MPQIINTNIMSLNTQRNLNRSQSALATSIQRLSSGLRINSAKDDAAGLGISERMTSQIRGLNQAVRNANDGISLAQTAEGALEELTNNLQRIRELAVQAANDTNSTSDRAALDQEVQQRLAEINRIANQTAFNNRKILDGTFGTATFQVGANVGETISLNLSTSMRTTDIGKTADYVGGNNPYNSSLNIGQQGTGVTSSALAEGALSISVGGNDAVAVGGSADYAGDSNKGQTSDSAYAKAGAINAAGISGLTATADTTVQLNLATTAVTTDSNSSYTLTINSTAIVSLGNSESLTADELVSAINANASATGVTATYDSSDTRITLQNVGGGNIVVNQSKTGSGTVSGGIGAVEGTNNSVNTTDSAVDGADKTYRGSIRLVASAAITLDSGASAIGYTAGSLALGNSALNSASVTTVSNAETTITRVDAALDKVTSLRGELGAIQNRFDSVIANLQTTSENLSAARSRIRDADFAEETAKLTRLQILQQAGVSMLAQANALPQLALSLLQ